MGLIGGMSWESTQTYYRLINQGVTARPGGLHSARLVQGQVGRLLAECPLRPIGCGIYRLRRIR